MNFGKVDVSKGGGTTGARGALAPLRFVEGGLPPLCYGPITQIVY